MIITLSPSKGQDFEQIAPTKTYTIPTQLDQSQLLVNKLKRYSKKKLAELMSISANLAELNQQRFQLFNTPFDVQNAKQALFSFVGDVYSGFNLSSMTQQDYEYAQDHLRILSGLYGCLKPLDLIQPYRLEMKTKLSYRRKANLYQFWGDSITQLINETQDDLVVNLASNEYWKSVNTKKLNANVIQVAFKENKDGESRIIAIFAKKARGMMADFIIRNRVETVDGLKDFDYEGYKFDSQVSSGNQMIFSRKQPELLNQPKKKKTKKAA